MAPICVLKNTFLWRHFMKKFILTITMVLFAMLLVSCDGATTGNTLDKDSEVYATNINMFNTAKTCYVGDTFILGNNVFTISPSSATVKPTVTINNKNILSYDDETKMVSCLAEGSVVITITVPLSNSTNMSKTVTVTVLPRPIYVSELSVDLESISMNLGDADVLNRLNVTPSVCSKNIEITYSEDGIVQYNGIYVKALAEGRTTVTCTDTYTSKSKSFEVVVTNHIYGTGVEIAEDTIYVEVGTGTIDFSILPNTFNMEYTVESKDEEIIEMNGRNYYAKKVGSTTIEIIYPISKTETAKRTVNVHVVENVSRLDMSFKLNGEAKTRAFVDNSLEYILTVTGDEEILDDIVSVNNAPLKTSADMKVTKTTNANNNVISYKIVFYRTGDYVFRANYTNKAGDKSIVSATPISIHAYNVMKNPQISFLVNEEELEKTEGVYNLSLIDNNKVADLSQVSEIPYIGRLVITHDGTDVFGAGYTVEVSSNNGVIEYSSQTGNVIAKKIGNSKITVVSTDDLERTFEIPFNVSEVSATDIKNNGSTMPTSIDLYLESTSSNYPSNISLLPQVIPAYAYNNQLVVQSSDSTIASYVNGKITAVGVGSCTITISCGSVEKDITITVHNYVKDMELDKVEAGPTSGLFIEHSATRVENIKITNGSRIEIFFDAIVSGMDAYDYFEFAYKNGDTSTIFSQTAGEFRGSIVLNAISVGTEQIIVTTQYDSEMVITINLTVIEYVSITKLEFDRDNYVFNVNETDNRTFTLSPVITPSSGYNDIVTFASSNTEVATVDNNGLVTIAEGITNGNCEISVYKNGIKMDEYNLIITNKIFIESISTTYSSSEINNISTKTNSSLNLVITPSNANVAVAYSTDNDKISVTNDGGFVVGNSAGNCKIMARYESAYGVFSETVFSFNIVIPVTSASFGADSYSLDLNTVTTATYTATILPVTHTSVITYSSSDTAVATVNNNGVVTGLRVGTATISVLVDGIVVDTYTLTVERVVPSVTVEDLIAALEGNKSITLTQDVSLPNNYSTISSYSGTLDGAGYSIKNLKTTFIGTNNGTIKNVKIEMTGSLSADSQGVVCNTNENKLEDVYLSGSLQCDLVSGKFSALAFLNNGVIDGCNSDLDVTTTQTGAAWSGAVNKNTGTISSTKVMGSCSGFSTTAGFLIDMNGGRITDCTVQAYEISIPSQNNCKIAGFIYQDSSAEVSCSIINCSASISILEGIDSAKIGGFMLIHRNTNIQINKCSSSIISNLSSSTNVGLFVYQLAIGDVSNFGSGVNTNECRAYEDYPTVKVDSFESGLAECINCL